MHSEPRVAAIMLTMAGREKWADQARHAFYAQTYGNAFLVESDAPTLTVGSKRNFAIRQAEGSEIIVHWDDDDIYHPERIDRQVKLLQENLWACAAGYHVMEFLNVNKGTRHMYCGRVGYAVGVSLCYWKQTWAEREFEPVNEGEDNAFQIGRRVVTVPSDGMIVARIHSGNTSAKHPERNPAQWQPNVLSVKPGGSFGTY